ncbi:hypothetical protein [Mesorhizobium sp. L2C067A000]|uniref:hypothetical protein n=1 Tax=Mesorhizobium sp. L2C067A000 TaxID=1287106 RepID=UPI0012DF8542|nr:hypothetical protein [Mesorhizobium sp. L2C067A000]
MTVPPALPRAAISPQRLPKQANDFSHLRLETANMRVEGMQRLVPALECGDDFGGSALQVNGLGLLVVLGKEAVDGLGD